MPGHARSGETGALRPAWMRRPQNQAPSPYERRRTPETLEPPPQHAERLEAVGLQRVTAVFQTRGPDNAVELPKKICATTA